MRILIVDGHSVVFAWPDLRKLHQRRMMLAREELVRRLTEYQDSTGTRVVLVFDGQGEKSSEATEPGGIQIFYSGGGHSADSVLERLAAKYAQTYDLTVASSDHLVQQTCITFGAFAITTEELRKTMEDATAELGRTIKKHRRKP